MPVLRLGTCKVADRTGFTFIEIAVVTAILGIMFLIAVPNLQDSLVGFRLNLAARQIASDMRLQQQRAISAKKEVDYSVLFDPDQETYILLEGYNQLKKVNLPPGVDLLGTNFGDNQIIFNFKGIPNPYGTVSLQDSHGRKRYVIVASTGRVRVDNLPPPKIINYGGG